MNFTEFLGQSNIIESLKNASKNNTVLHSYIFEGPNGIGKKTVARTFAQLLLCENNESNPCGECKSCHLFEVDNHPDINIISSDKTISVSDIREMVKDVAIKPYYGGKKVYIIENADKMTIQAQNSLLKTLEEPPEYVVIILTCESLNSLLPTIISRCIIKKFMRNTKEDIEKYIHLKHPQISENLNTIVSLADGIIGNVNKIIKNNNFFEMREQTLEILKTVVNGTKLEAFESAEFFIKQKDNIDLILNLMLLWLRDLLIIKETNSKEIITNTDFYDYLLVFSKKIDTITIHNGIKAVVEAKNNLLSNANYSVTIEVMILKFKNYQGAIA